MLVVEAENIADFQTADVGVPHANLDILATGEYLAKILLLDPKRLGSHSID
jgi:hypothetical protein